MTRYECHGCWKVYDDEEGMPPKCCGKTIRHKVDDGKCEDGLEHEVVDCPNCFCQFCTSCGESDMKESPDKTGE